MTHSQNPSPAQETKRPNYIKPLDAAQMPVIYHRLRGKHWPKEEGGQINVGTDPNRVQHVLFFRAGAPIALATIKGAEKRMGAWQIDYGDLKWLQNERPESEFQS